MHRVFVSYHHQDQVYKDTLALLNVQHSLFVDMSVNTGEVSDDLPDEAIRERIRDDYLRDSKVTLVLVGHETRRRKHVDWEIYSSMHNGTKNKKSGVVVVTLPGVAAGGGIVHGAEERGLVYPDVAGWTPIIHRTQFENGYPCLPARIVDNLVENVPISVVPWNRAVADFSRLRYLIDAAFAARGSCNYTFSRPMKRDNR